MIGSAIGVSVIAKELGASPRGQIFAAVVSLTIPMGILQASSTQTDYVAAFWLVCFVYWMFSLKAKGDLLSTVAAGASLGLAVLSKSTAYMFAFPFLVWFGFLALKVSRARAIFLLGVLALCVIFINLGPYTRNYKLFANPLGITQEVKVGHYTFVYKFANDVFSLRALASNVIRNIALHMGTSFDTWNSYLEEQIARLHQTIGISENDPDTTWFGTEFYVPPILFFESSDGNVLHAALILVSGFFIMFQRGRKRDMISYALCLLFGFLALCFYLKWQPWNSRLHLALFVLYLPILGRAAEEIRSRSIARAMAILMLLSALPWVFLNRTRPLIGSQNILAIDRTRLYFQNKASIEHSYGAAVQFVSESSNKKCKSLGLYLDADDVEYPFWVLLQQRMGKGVLIEAVHVENVSSKTYADFPIFRPCAVFANSQIPVETLDVNGVTYTSAQTFDTSSVLFPK